MGQGLVVGAARADITPDPAEGAFLAGFAMNRRAVGVLEPLEAGALYVSDGERAVVLVTADVIGLLQPTVARIRERAAPALGDAALVVTSTHTHSGPDTMGLWGPAFFGAIPRGSGVDPAYMDLLVARVADAIGRAVANARPATLRLASFDVPARWTRNDRKGGGRYDTATAAAFDEAGGGGRIATVLNFASHPETLWEDNRHVSPDFPGAFRRHTAARRGGTPLYFTGPLGGMLTPNVPRDADEAGRRAYAEALGEALAALADEALEAAAPEVDPALTHRSRAVDLPNDNWRFRLAVRFKLIPYDLRGGAQSEVHHLRLGALEILTAPGEVLPELGHRAREAMTAPHRMLLCLAMDELGYILEPRMFDDREYAYEVTMSLGRDTADRLVAAWRELAA